MTKFAKPRKRAKKPIHISKIIRASVIQRDKGVCRLCNQQAVDLHHMLFKSLGGNNSALNLISLCRHHHQLAHSHQHKYFKILFASQKEIYKDLKEEDLKK